ncbi:MAG: alanine--tRNA ligase, partial [Patescibacteria group bacterium]
MKARQIRQSFLDFFKEKAHQIVASSSLIPADPTVLFTSAGMQQFVPYLSGEVEPPYRRAASCQKCFRTSDIDRVGDESHHTFFEMLGNWSFGDYFKEEAIEMALELLMINYHLPLDRLWVTVFKGERNIPKDEESIKFWQKNGISRDRIKEFGTEDNFWGPVGFSGPCGPCSEIHYDRGEKFRTSECDIKGCGPNCHCGRFVEIWNLVFMEYNKTKDGKFEKLPAKNVDTGAGLERLACVLQKTKSNFETDLFLPIIQKIESLSKTSYSQQPKAYRIIADHIRGICFLIADGVLPSKEDRGYVLRRIIRRAMRYSKFLELGKQFLIPIAQVVIDQYKDIYPELQSRQTDILTVIQNEEERFSKTLGEGLKRFEKIVSRIDMNLPPVSRIIPSQEVFHLYDTYGFPFELTKELAEERGLGVSKEDFEKEFSKHQEISRAGVKKKFGGVGEWGEKVAPHHTATHLLHSALRQVLGKHVHQAGSDLTPERLRFDFTHPKKLSNEEIKKVEEIVNQKIKENLLVKMEEMPYEEAIKSGALAFFKEKYSPEVFVYSIGDFSREVCAGPHVKRTLE